MQTIDLIEKYCEGVPGYTLAAIELSLKLYPIKSELNIQLAVFHKKNEVIDLLVKYDNIDFNELKGYIYYGNAFFVLRGVSILKQNEFMEYVKKHYKDTIYRKLI